MTKSKKIVIPAQTGLNSFHKDTPDWWKKCFTKWKEDHLSRDTVKDVLYSADYRASMKKWEVILRDFFHYLFDRYGITVKKVMGPHSQKMYEITFRDERMSSMFFLTWTAVC
jgi:hypothetical protein